MNGHLGTSQAITNIDVFKMVTTHCPICRSGPKIDCSDMNRCPLILAKYKGEIITPEDFAGKHGIRHMTLKVEPKQAGNGQFELF